MRSQLVGEAGSERDASVVLQSDFDAHAARKSKGSNKRFFCWHNCPAGTTGRTFKAQTRRRADGMIR
eukprot:CAMPEP_0115307832 /NCGR_PEP_ID=MMETSP0270-20121206/73355_1 /TAXON_ID=71861 /ORGANISM="Scrippsiella trochoidea, Strain CCMP3099" /LENGTH=66 /DNA_ID=CAMNT_0002726309 /DNA_START=530 /DNA_END=730 /DNA_ORIENTATION=-